MVRNIILEREEKGLFIDFVDFVVRMYKYDIRKEEVAILIDAGAFDEFNINRNSLRKSLDSVLNYGEILQGILDQDIIDRPKINEINSIITDDLRKEKEILGIFISKFPDVENIVPTNKIKFYLNQEIKVLGFLSNIKTIKTKNNTNMGFIDLYDNNQNIELVLFSENFDKYQNYVNKDDLFLVTGRVNIRNNRINLIVNKMERLGNL